MHIAMSKGSGTQKFMSSNYISSVPFVSESARDTIVLRSPTFAQDCLGCCAPSIYPVQLMSFMGALVIVRMTMVGGMAAPMPTPHGPRTHISSWTRALALPPGSSAHNDNLFAKRGSHTTKSLAIGMNSAWRCFLRHADEQPHAKM